MKDFTPAQLSNLITACKTSKMRDGSIHWQVELNQLAEKLAQLRAELEREISA